MMRAQVHVFAVEIICPKCEEPIPEPKICSQFWSVDDAIPNEIRCPHCERVLTVKLPKDIG